MTENMEGEVEKEKTFPGRNQSQIEYKNLGKGLQT